MIDLKTLGPISNLKSFTQGEVVIHENDLEIKEMFILLAGTVGVYKKLGTQNSFQLSELQPGSVFGEMSLFTNEARCTSVVALSNITTIRITKENFFELIEKNPSATIQIIESLCRRLAQVNDKIAQIAMDTESAICDVPQIAPEHHFKTSLFPKEHGNYPIQEPASFSTYTLTTNMTCPCCDTTFATRIPYISKLKISKPMGCDMRKYTVDFDTVWYDITTCPHCYFSCLTNFFENTAIFSKSKEVEDALAEIKKHTVLDFNAPRTLDFVFAMHYLALICAKAYTNEKQMIAKLWLQLTYLYKDTKDEVIYLYSVKQASEHYEFFYSSSNMKIEQEQTCCLILAHLFFVLKEIDKSMFYLSKVRTNKEGSALFKRLCDLKIDEIRTYKQSLKNNNDN